jgi:hypothetical protein
LLQERRNLALQKPAPKNGTLPAAAARQRERLAPAEPELEKEVPQS